MILIKPSIEVLKMDDIKLIEVAGRTCYKSEDRITDESAKDFVKMLINRGHEAMVEHASASVKIICDRGVSHEIVRHRLFSYAQESSRYCNYSKDKFGNQCTYIIPNWLNITEGCYRVDGCGENAYYQRDEFEDWQKIEVDRSTLLFLRELYSAEQSYLALIQRGWTAQQSRNVLPHALKTELIITGNFREWRHFFKLRCAKESHPQMREVANMILEKFVALCPDMIWR